MWVCVCCCHVVVVDLMVKLICGLARGGGGEATIEEHLQFVQLFHLIIAKCCHKWNYVFVVQLCVCVTVLSNFDWKTCLTSCDFSQPFRAYVQHCRPMRLTSIKWHKRHNKQLLSRAVRQSLRQSVAQSVSQSTSRGVGILSQAAAAACLAAAYGA